jgi:meso-butanediol dehydrogenase/(S,S)-butanediol dehydrogenase/diacetyl reductase
LFVDWGDVDAGLVLPEAVGNQFVARRADIMRFENKNVLVTGATGGIGRETCFQFASDGAGVAVTDVDLDLAERVAEEIREKGGTAEAFALDVTDPQAITDAIAAAAEKLGGLDVIFCNAGIREIVPVLDLSAEEFAKVIQINVTGVFLCGQAFARYLIDAGKPGAIVNTASTLGVMGSPARAAYTASKHAVVGLTKQMAMEFGEQGIRVNAVGPGVIRTPLTERYFQNEEQAQGIRDLHSLGRWGEAVEVAKAVLFLASDDASFCTGSHLLVDGGWTAGKKI